MTVRYLLTAALVVFLACAWNAPKANTPPPEEIPAYGMYQDMLEHLHKEQVNAYNNSLVPVHSSGRRLSLPATLSPTRVQREAAGLKLSNATVGQMTYHFKDPAGQVRHLHIEGRSGKSLWAIHNEAAGASPGPASPGRLSPAGSPPPVPQRRGSDTGPPGHATVDVQRDIDESAYYEYQQGHVRATNQRARHSILEPDRGSMEELRHDADMEAKGYRTLERYLMEEQVPRGGELTVIVSQRSCVPCFTKASRLAEKYGIRIWIFYLVAPGDEAVLRAVTDDEDALARIDRSVAASVRMRRRRLSYSREVIVEKDAARTWISETEPSVTEALTTPRRRIASDCVL